MAMLDKAQSFAIEFWIVLADMSPYLLFGFFFAGLLAILISAEAVERHLGGRGMLPVAKAAAFGVPLPLCSCGVIPVAASLRRHGASRGATTAFVISTPQTGVDSIFVTFSLLGATFAIFRPLAALATGLIGGWLIALLVSEDRTTESAAAVGDEPCCEISRSRGKLLQMLEYGFVTLPRDIGRALVVGLIVAGIITVVFPQDFFSERLGSGIVAKLVMMAVGIPIYVCATGSVPIAAALMAKGISAGAALVFLMTGPATNAATVAMIWKTGGRKTVIIYLATIALGALAFGTLLDQIYAFRPHVAEHVHTQRLIPAYVNTACALVLIALLANALLRPRLTAALSASAIPPGDETATLLIGGMTCSGCAKTVEQTLLACTGVKSARVNLTSRTAYVTGSQLNLGVLCRAVQGAGYSAKTHA